jgi:hypothetical protein
MIGPAGTMNEMKKGLARACHRPLPVHGERINSMSFRMWNDRLLTDLRSTKNLAAQGKG